MLSRLKWILLIHTDPPEAFNLDFYTEVQDLSHLQHALSESSPRFGELNIRICELIEDYSYVGFETLAVEVRVSTPKSSRHENDFMY